MVFILLLGLGAFALATVSAFFSIWGLAHTFSGIFQSMIAMGIAIEYGKLIGISFLYRFWDNQSKALKRWLFSPMIAIVFIVMCITAMGHYGYLSSGYQADILPLKQLNEQVRLLEDEKQRKIDRKKEIDAQIAQLPNDFVRGRERLMRQFKTEQQEVTNRVNEIDKQLLSLRTESIKVETHVGPITYIAKAFNVDTDRATSYLVLLIICVFDPLAILLTIATNVAIREKEKQSKKKLDGWATEDFVQLSDEEMKKRGFNGSKVEKLPIPTSDDLTEEAPLFQEYQDEKNPEEIYSEAEPVGVQPVPNTPEDDLLKEVIESIHGNHPPSIPKLRQAAKILADKKELTEIEANIKSRINEMLQHYEAQNYVLRRGSSLNS